MQSDVTHALTPNQTRFLKCFEACASVTQAARWSKVTRAVHYIWLEESEVYKQAFAKSEKIAGRTLEDEAVRRAHEGIRKTIRYKGKVVGHDREYSDTLMLALLKGHLPEKYKDRSSIETNNKTTFDVASVRAFMADDSTTDE